MKRLTTLTSQPEAKLANKALHSLKFRTFHNGEFTPCQVEIKDGRIAAVFSIEEKECGKGFLIPSFTEAHLHLLRLARTYEGVDLRQCNDNVHLLTLLKEYAKEKPAPGWIIGSAFNANLWQGEPPKQHILNEHFPHRPVLLKNIDLHSGLFNEQALTELGIEAERGMIYEEPFWEAEGRVPVAKGKALVPLLLRTVRALNKAGITAVQSFDGQEGEETVKDLAHSCADFTLRVMGSRLAHEFAVSEAFPATKKLWLKEDGSLARFAPGPLKLFIDGALNSQTALLEDDYENEPGKRGIAILHLDQLKELVAKGNRAGRPVAVHAIGDKANRWAVEAFASLPQGSCEKLRHRIEHGQLLPQGLEKQMAALSLFVTTLPPHLPFDIVPALKHWGTKRSQGLHVLRSMVEAGVKIALTSDAPVAPFSPLSSFHIALFRQGLDGQVFLPQECLAPHQALAALTKTPAQMLFGEKHWGEIKVGMSADLVLLSHNPLTMKVHTPMKVQATLFGGQLVHGCVDGGNA